MLIILGSQREKNLLISKGKITILPPISQVAHSYGSRLLDELPDSVTRWAPAGENCGKCKHMWTLLYFSLEDGHSNYLVYDSKWPIFLFQTWLENAERCTFIVVEEKRTHFSFLQAYQAMGLVKIFFPYFPASSFSWAQHTAMPSRVTSNEESLTPSIKVNYPFTFGHLPVTWACYGVFLKEKRVMCAL